MSIALIVEKASADALLRSARNQVDSNAYEVFNSVVELNGRYSSTDASSIGIDRLIIFDSDTTLGTGNLLDTNLQILNMFLGKAEKIESIALVKKAREDRINQYRTNVNHPHSLIIPLSDRLEASFLADLLTLSLKDIADTYTTFATTYEEASKRITNKEIKESVDQVAAGWRAAADNSGVLKADPLSMDVQKLEEYHKIMEDLSAKQTELFNKCGYQH